MSSGYDAWADRYRGWTTSVTADVPFYVGLARDAVGPPVELAVGNGRVAIPAAQATGRRDAFAFDHHVASAIDGRHADTPLPHTNYYSVGDNRVDITLDDGGTGSLWWATKNEWLGLLDVAGLRLEAL